jgi:hypothetical protein
MEHRVEKHSPRPFRDGLEGSFGHAVLVMGYDAGEVDFLIHGVDMVNKVSEVENAVVGMVFLYLHAGDLKGYKAFLAFDGVASSEGRLVRAKNHGGRMINAKSAANTFVFGLLASSGVGKLAGITGLVLIE